MKKVLAIDMGATSIRGIVGYVQDGVLITEEVMRMSHKIVKEGETLCWQWKELLAQVSETIRENADTISSVGVDTWGVDFGLLDENGQLLQSPMSYREPKHAEGHQEAVRRMSEEDIFLHTGNQVMSINTLFQLLALRKEQPEVWKRAKKILMMPDLFQYMLTGNAVGEETIWSTSQIFHLGKREISQEILKVMDLSPDLFPKPILAGEVTGTTGNARLEELRDLDLPVISVCGHDTASAVLLTEAFTDTDTMFLSCGTWSLIGGVVEECVIDTQAYQKSLTNEIGYHSRPMFFKNITGLFLLEKYKQQLEEARGTKIDFAEITAYVENTTGRVGILDMEDPAFSREDGKVKEAMDAFLQKSNQDLPSHEMEYFRIIYASLAQKYLETKEAIEDVLGKKYKKVHMIGGGAKSSYLCQLIADKLGLPVVAGPFEATALGNILVQLKTLGEISSLPEGIELVQKSQKVNHYQPKL